MKINDFGNKHAPFGDDDIAASITLTGQAVIKQSNELLKRYIKGKAKIEDEKILNDCIIYNDTDSLVHGTNIETSRGVEMIGDIFDKLNCNNIIKSDKGHDTIEVDNLYVKTFHSKYSINKFSKVKRVIRHKVSKRKFKIKCNGKEVIMTEDHGLMVKRGNDIIRISPKEYEKGDKIITTTFET